MIDPIVLALASAAFVAGVAGSWSPCGFSMVSTIGHGPGGRASAPLGSMTFTVGALIGGTVTFGGLALLGHLIGSGGRIALIGGAAIAGAAAVAELRGTRIVPQIRRQVPEGWRRSMPLPVAAWAYGVLLGLGFTTFVLSFAVPALAGVSLALGDPALGLVLGLAFGAGRALPIAVLAPLADHAIGHRAIELMAGRPATLRLTRAACGVGLLAVAAAVATGPEGPEPAEAQSSAISGAYDPTIAGSTVAWSGADGAARVEHMGNRIEVPGRKPAVGGPNLAYLSAPGEITVVRRTSLAPVVTVAARNAEALAVSDRWLAWLARSGSVERIVATPIPAEARETRDAAGEPPFEARARTVARARAPIRLSRPSLWRNLVVYGVVGREQTRIVERRLPGGRPVTRRRGGRGFQVLNPGVHGGWITWVRTSQTTQEVRLGRRSGRGTDRRLHRIAAATARDRGFTRGRRPHHWVRRNYQAWPRGVTRQNLRSSVRTLWTTTLGPRHALATRLTQSRGDSRPSPSVVRLRRR